MQKLRATIFLFSLWCGAVFAQTLPGQSGLVIESANGVFWEGNKNIVIATNGVVVKYGDAVLSANRAVVTNNTGDVVAEGSVGLQYEGQVWLGESLHYNFYTKKIIGENFRSGSGLFYSHSDVFVGDIDAGVYVGAKGFLTTDDYAKPAYGIYAKTLIIVPGEYIEAKHAKVYLGKVPVFYLPYYRKSLKKEGARFEFVPGYRSSFGPYLYTTYHAYTSEPFDASLHLDGRLDRGPAAGPDLEWRLKPWGDGGFKYYYAQDEKPGLDNNGKPIDENRYRLWFAHQANPNTNLTLTAVARYQTDPFVVHDFFEGEYTRNIQPSTFIEANQRWSNFSLDALAQPRINDFFETVERLPDIKFTGLRQQIGATPLYYESDSSFGYYRRKFAAGSTNEVFSAARADTFHQIVLPQTYFNWLNVTPRVGGRFTYYGEAEGPGAMTTEQERGVFNTGAEVTFKVSRVWPEAQSRLFQIDGLRHIIQPSVNYSFVPRPSVSPQELPQFDYVVPTTRLLPIEFPDFNAIDAIDSQNVIRLGLRNKLQTKRKGQLDNVVHWALYTDWRLTRNDQQDTFSDLYSDLDLRPFSWLTLSSQLRYGLRQTRLNEAIHQLAFTPNDTWSFSLGHRYLREDLASGINYADNLFLTTFYYRINENWGLRMSHQYQALNGVLQEQDYTIYRDFRSWTGALTFRVRDNRSGPLDYTVAVTFSFKAFPRYKVNEDQVYPSRLLGY